MLVAGDLQTVDQALGNGAERLVVRDRSDSRYWRTSRKPVVPVMKPYTSVLTSVMVLLREELDLRLAARWRGR